VVKVSVRGRIVAGDVSFAATFFQRFFGLLGRRNIAREDGMLFVPGGSVHTIGMRCTIDVAFLDKNNVVLKVCRQVRPYRFCFAPVGTSKTLELAPGVLNESDINPGDGLLFSGIKE